MVFQAGYVLSRGYYRKTHAGRLSGNVGVGRHVLFSVKREGLKLDVQIKRRGFFMLVVH
jgi:hypothetical protein